MKLNKTQRINGMFLLVILISTLFSWFGGARGIQEIKGIMVLVNPLMLIFIILIVSSIFNSNTKVMNILAVVGFGGIVCVEIYYFLTWYILTITGKFSLIDSFNWAYPEFYIAFIITLIAFIVSMFNFFKSKTVVE